MATDPDPPLHRQPDLDRGAPAALLASLALASGALILFDWLTEELLGGRLARFDLNVRAAIHQLASPGVTRAFIVISFLGSPQFLTPLFAVAIVILLLVHWRRAAGWLALSMVGAVVLDIMLKPVFHRARPQPFFVEAPHSYSFPSGHALASFCFYLVLAGIVAGRVGRRALRVIIWTVATALVVAVGISRIYLGVHYPTDVVAGYAAAAVWVGTLLSVDTGRKGRL